MKAKTFSFILVLFLSICFSMTAQDKKKNNKGTVTFDVSMTCGRCKNKIEKNIAFEKGVTDMSVDLPNKTVTIEFQSNKTDTVKLKQALEKLGYDVQTHIAEAK